VFKHRLSKKVSKISPIGMYGNQISFGPGIFLGQFFQVSIFAEYMATLWEHRKSTRMFLGAVVLEDRLSKKVSKKPKVTVKSSLALFANASRSLTARFASRTVHAPSDNE